MIASLEGIREIVNFDENSNILLYDNTDYEEYPIHWHTPLEIVVPINGKYRIECNDVPITLNEGDIAIIAPGVLHKMYEDRGRRIIFQVNLSLLQSLKEIESFISYMGPFAVITPSEYPNVHPKALDCMLNILNEGLSQNTYKETAMYSNFLQMFTTIARAYSESHERFASIKPNKMLEYNETFMNICDYINKNCTKDISLDEISEMAGFSKYHFSRLFKEFTNYSFYRYLNMRRILHAEQLLLDPSVKITEVAMASGFNSISAFMRMFKNLKGCTPTDYKEFHKQ